MADRILDVRTEIPKRRHELIFETFGELAPGTAYVLVNDHDPKPLRYQFEAELPGQFSWAYLEEGPEVWRVRIGRTAAAVGLRASKDIRDQLDRPFQPRGDRSVSWTGFFEENLDRIMALCGGRMDRLGYERVT